MVYNSLWNELSDESRFIEFLVKQMYFGTLNDVLSETEEILDSGCKNTDSVQLALQAPRIIRGFIDYKIEFPLQKEAEPLLRDAIQLGLHIYKRDVVAIKEIKELKRKIIHSKNKELLERKLEQPECKVTLWATRPLASERTAKNLSSELNGKNVLFIALAHGGIAAGMDTYLRYCDFFNNKGSEFYVARCSIRKWHDDIPRVSANEIKYLRKLSLNRYPVIFDADVSTGHTLMRSCEFFREKVFTSKNLITLTNYDQISDNNAIEVH